MNVIRGVKVVAKLCDNGSKFLDLRFSCTVLSLILEHNSCLSRLYVVVYHRLKNAIDTAGETIIWNPVLFIKIEDILYS